ncbi:hypothetical protein B0T16DRAFT_147506 [Cercophora newfieldiana]|uniref:Uncharacterized protein n=1 Tax=Cercophora newfieldiana TaxID=92897 RepID=A0AA40CQF5_9PEZI|nr:hypothetical protein B0T16DRAFT_147506 [Cercophora newfieldiana]
MAFCFSNCSRLPENPGYQRSGETNLWHPSASIASVCANGRLAQRSASEPPRNLTAWARPPPRCHRSRKRKHFITLKKGVSFGSKGAPETSPQPPPETLKTKQKRAAALSRQRPPQCHSFPAASAEDDSTGVSLPPSPSPISSTTTTGQPAGLITSHHPRASPMRRTTLILSIPASQDALPQKLAASESKRTSSKTNSATWCRTPIFRRREHQ